MSSRNVLLSLLAVAVLALGGGAYYVLGAGNAEPSVDVADAVDDLDATAEGSAAAGTTFEVDQSLSRVAYLIDEVLRGEETTVLGTTAEVAATLTIDPADPTSVDLGAVAVNARTLTSDSSNRDRAVRGRILATDDPANELITFTATEVGDVPADVSGSFTVDVTGDLTIAGTTTPVTFPLTVTPEGDGYRVTGEAVVLRSDYGLTVPNVPFVADVSDEVTLQLDLVLVPATA